MVLNHVFVYGTLCRGECNHSVAASFVINVQEASMTGWLYDLPYGYPAMTCGDGSVRGQLFTLDVERLNEALKQMDRLESYKEGRADNEYERITTMAVTDQGEEVACYTYVYPKEKQEWLNREAVFVADGDWRAHKRGQSWLPYFAYGSCMSQVSFAVDVPEFRVMGRAVLPDYRVGFTRFSQLKWNGGVADIIPAPRETMEGVLYFIPPELLPNLDAREGAGYAYSRETVQVRVGEKLIEAITYMVIDKEPDMAPSEAYQQTILEGCDLLSEEYVRKLKEFMGQL